MLYCRRYGYSPASAYQVGLRLLPAVRTEKGRELKDELTAFVAEESMGLGMGERILGSSEILESAFGKLKSYRGKIPLGRMWEWLIIARNEGL